MEGIASPSKPGFRAFVRDPEWAQTFGFGSFTLPLRLGYFGKFESQNSTSFNKWVKN